MSTQFNQESPANDLEELLALLQSEDAGQFVYRGQTKHYGTLVPSAFRRVMQNPARVERGYIAVDSRKHAKIEESEPRYRQKFRGLSWLIEGLGKAMGNIIAQQYGLSSEAIDVTDDLGVAGFFASHSFPSYEVYHSAGDGDLGVLYRLRKWDSLGSLQTVEKLLENVAIPPTDSKPGAWFEHRVKSSLATAQEEKAILELFATHGSDKVLLSTPPLMVTPDDLKTWLNSELPGKGWSTARSLHDTRISRQSGGFILPPYIWRGRVPHVLHGQKLSDGMMLCTPSLAAIDELVSFGDALETFEVESFFFRHNERSYVSKNRETLWPGIMLDDIYEQLVDSLLFDKGVREYLDKCDIEIEDRKSGLLDRGFYTGHEKISKRGKYAMVDKDFDKAIRCFSVALRRTSCPAEIYTYRGSCYREIDNLELALADLSDAVNKNPEAWDAWSSISTVLLELGRPREALDAAEKACALKPRRTELLLNRASANDILGNYSESIPDLTEAAKDFAHRSTALSRLALTYCAGGMDEKSEEVLSDFKEIYGSLPAGLAEHLDAMRTSRNGREEAT